MNLSIILVVKNNALGISKTLTSLKQQKELFKSEFELVVIDGASTDGTVAAVDSYGNLIDIFVSESDRGIYNAMNKGLSLASGDALFFLNSGDQIVGPLFKSIADLQPPLFVRVKHRNFFGFQKFVPLRNRRYRLPNCHQGIIFDRQNIYYDESFKIAADYKYFLDHKYSEDIFTLGKDCYVEIEDAGVNVKFFKLRDREMFIIRSMYFGPFIGFLYQLPIMIKGLIRRLF
jgi:putative colanic acid biosynthesis glycosyltransferase